MKSQIDRRMHVRANRMLTAILTTAITAVSSSHSPCLADVTNGLVAFYQFNGTATDTSGNGNHAVGYDVSATTDRFAAPVSAYDFNGASSYIDIPQYPSLDLTTQFTLSAWIYQTDAQSAGYRIIDKCNAGLADGFLFDTYGTNTGGRQLRLIGVNHTSQAIGATQYSLRNWHHVVATVSGTVGKVYLNGNLDGTGDVGSLPHNSLDMYVGRAHPTWAGFTEWFKGAIDDVRIYNRALTATEVWQLSQDHAATVNSLPEYQYDGASGPQTIRDLRAPDNSHISFVFATTNIGARCLVSWTTTLREWFALLHFDASAVGTEVTDTTSAPLTFYRTTYLPVGVSSAEGFDYPIGTGESIPEQITPERNNIYPNGARNDPFREAVSPTTAWRNAQDVGAYYSAFGGLHPGEDWNNGSQSDADVGESVRAVANGQVIEIRPVSASGVPSAAGYAMVIRHWLLNGDSVDSLYVHIAPDRNGGSPNDGGIIGDENDFTYQVGAPVTKGSTIAVIGAVSAFSPHLHFEMRNKKLDVSGPLWPHSTGDAYYGPEVGSAGNRSPTISQADVEAAFGLMQADGIIDPSDFIDDHRP